MDIEAFDRAVVDAIDAALDADVGPDELEMVLQQRAQEMRELDEWQRTQDGGGSDT